MNSDNNNNNNDNHNSSIFAYGCLILFLDEAILGTIVVRAKNIMSKILDVGPGSSV